MDFSALNADVAGMLVNFGLKVMGVLALLFVARIVAKAAARAVERGARRSEVDETLTRFFGNLTRWAVMLFAVLGCLGVFGVETTSFAAVLGGAGLAVGLAFQGTLSSFSAGVMLLVFRPFKVGDVVTVSGVTGKVHEIELFTTTLDTPDNRRFILPNSAVFGSTIENISHHGTRRVDVTIGVAYDADLDRTREVLAQAIADVAAIQRDPEPAIVLGDLDASSVNWHVRVWVEAGDYWAVREALLGAAKRRLDAAKIGIPYQTFDVNLVGGAGA